MTDSFSNSVSIIIPTLNEEENILPLVAEIAACAVPFREILFVDVPIVFRERVYGKSKMSFGVALRFFSAGSTRWSSISSAVRLGMKEAQAWLAQRRRYIQRLQESSADASRQTRLELSPNTTTITSLPGRVPLAIKHLPAASV